MHLTALQMEVGAWGKRTFPDSTPDTIMNHLAEEMIELLGYTRVRKALHRYEANNNIFAALPVCENPAEESADILLMLCHLASRLGYSLEEATLRKFAEVRDAEWVDDGRGYKKRVKD